MCVCLCLIEGCVVELNKRCVQLLSQNNKCEMPHRIIHLFYVMFVSSSLSLTALAGGEHGAQSEDQVSVYLMSSYSLQTDSLALNSYCV